MSIHACLKCVHSQSFDKPMSMTTGNHLHLAFTCTNPSIPDAYGYLGKRGDGTRSNVMIMDLVTNQCWVDGSDDVPVTGCATFAQYNGVNVEVE